MINVYLNGGMANQMFQFAMGYAQAKKFRTGLILDFGSFLGDPMREYSLDLWAGIRGQYTKVTGSFVDVYENGMPFNPAVLAQITPESCIKGYWQTEKYFRPYGQDLYKIFSPSRFLSPENRDMLREIKEKGNRSVFLTVRRTDYVGNQFHGEMTMEYYLLALERLSNQAKITPHVFVFSDDPYWCGENFLPALPYEATVAGNFDRTVKGHIGREDEELFLMRNCQNAIMANSSYSWWGAYMGDHNTELDQKSRIVICPSKWFGPASNEDPRDIPRENWIQL